MQYVHGMQDAVVERYRSGQAPRLLQRIASGSLTRPQLTEVISIRYQVAHFFEDMLRCLIHVIDDASDISDEARPQLRHAVQANLDDELGKAGYGSQPHLEGRRDMLQALGIDYDQWSSQLGTYNHFGDVRPAALGLLVRMRHAVMLHPLAGVAALLEYEHRISLHGAGDYWMLLQGLEKLFPELCPHGRGYREGDPFWHIFSHAQHDDHHAKLAEDGLVAAIRNENDAMPIFSGLVIARYAVDCFWIDLESAIGA